MLCQFTFQNFKSYKNEATLDFQATAAPEFADTLIQDSSEKRFLPVSVIYGPNGGGKSNILSAFAALVSTVVEPIHALKKNRQDMIFQYEVDVAPFLLDETSKTESTSFEVFFQTGNREYCYSLSILDEQVTSESLYWKTVGGKRIGLLFEREGSNITPGASIKKKGITYSVNPKMPYLTFLAINYDIPSIVEVQNWFESCIVRNYASPFSEQFVMIPRKQLDLAKLIHALNDMGIDLSGLRLDPESQKLFTQRTVNGKVYELDFEAESAGTQKIIETLPGILLALKEGRLIVIDELDAKLHPKLLRYIISLFKNKEVNTHGAQLLFSSQDISTMKNTIFRRDEIWFAAENQNHESEIYSLYEIRREDNERVKNTSAYDKQYLEGRYGADPYLTNMLSGGEWM